MNVIALDIETTGLDYNKDEIVSVSLVGVKDDGSFDIIDWILKTEVESSPEALAKHKITREIQDKDGKEQFAVITELTDFLLTHEGVIVTANGAFDLTMIQSTMSRWEHVTQLDLSDVKMVDIMVLDKFIDKYRKGSRTLESLADHYNVNYSGVPHNSTFDAIVTYAIYKRLVPILEDEGYTESELPKLCEVQYNAQRKDLAAYFEKIGKKATISTGYPVNTGEIRVG